MIQFALNAALRRVIHTLYRLIEPPTHMTETQERHRSRLLSAILLTLISVGSLIVLDALSTSGNPFDDPDLVGSIIGLFLSGGLYILCRKGYTNVAAFGIVGLTSGIFVFLPFAPNSGSTFLVYATTPIVLTGIFFSMKWVMRVSVLVILSATIMNNITTNSGQIESLIYYLVLASAIFITFVWHLGIVEALRRQELEEKNHQLQESEASLERRVADRTRDLQIAAAVSRQVTSVVEMEQLLPQLANLTRDEFNLYHASVFLFDKDSNTLRLVAGSGDRGLQMRASGKQFNIEDKGLVPLAARSTFPQVINDIQHSPDHFVNPLLLDTRAEAALPMRVGHDLIGVLDLQADEIDRFQKDDIQVLQTLADQIAIAVRNADLFTTAESARTQAEQANTVKSQFLAAMSHELRTPLNAIINFTQFVSTGMLGDVNVEQSDILEKVVHSGEHLLSLINDVLDISKIEAGALKLFVEEDVNLEKELDTVVATAQSLLANKPVQLSTKIAPHIPFVVGDKRRIRQIMLNLVSNACKFTEDGSVHIELHQQDEAIQFTVRDTGPGIAVEDADAVFETFRQTTTGLRQGEGTGLGLPISRRLAEAHGGRLWFESAPGAGSIFHFKIPIQAAELMPLINKAKETHHVA
jgi:signal transduction histidine kinase